MIKVFNTLSEYSTYVEGDLVSGDLYYVKEDDSVHFQTNNIDGELAVYNFAPDSVFVDASFTENGVYDPADYNADGFATVAVSVPVPDGYVLPSGNLNITSNASSIDVAQYATVAVNVAAPTPQYTALNLNTIPANSDGKNFSTLISATVGQTIEIYNPNHLIFAVGQAQFNINPMTGETDGYQIFQNGIGSYDSMNDSYLEHLYVTNAPNTLDGAYSDYGFCINYYSAAGTPVDGVIYYRVF